MAKPPTRLIVFLFLFSTFSLLEIHGEFEPSRTLEQEQGNVHEVHCSRERSKAAWKIVEEYLMPFVEKEGYRIPSRCRLHPENDMYRDQEEHKIHAALNEWRCGYCKKTFYEEKYLDKHFDNRHYDMLNVTHRRCLADVCGALHCDRVMSSLPHKTKCNPAAAARNKHLCESLASSCFPVNEGSAAHRLNELFLRQFCDSHSCSGGQKLFSLGSKKKTSVLYIITSVLILILLSLFYIFMYLYQRGLKRGTQELKRISRSGQKKKPS
ncbi:hypothetical protein K2173_021024 [Erythroxylum novogranatense]|uniref:C2H2-type domain-containing protein n=1 Tax=Erythroxylum novogranatense TaxID=1862640 RepID=A0AAV8TPL3_9ROSI|nr:hypothetical protein K2173_021024 [Erythroxylum novogranatense]